ncbi:MAG: restriction endonuclease [Treponema sp.]|uniref:restriction endonuclease n=1 Tax=Treponema sp. TaxID=166 RepID=UPI0025E0E55A|nr:restriction endonuclease [Treponema sp.]MBR0496630.1 restriction endonuclease [Treponema sp.]
MQTIPDYQTLMLPLLKNVSDGKEHKIKEIMESLSKEFSLGEEELNMMIPSGTQSIFYNRVSWAKTHLKKACLLNVEKGIIKITERGKNVLAENPVKIDTKFLNQFDEFLEFKNRSNSKKEKIEVEPDYTKQTPEELIDTAFQDFQKSLAEDLLEKIRNVSPSFFEKLVVALLVKMGYGGSIKDAGKAVGKTGDEGIDGIIKEDKLGLDVIYIQAKRWKENNIIGRPEIQKFVGALAGQGAKKGIFITASSFSKEALEYKPMNDTKVILIDGMELANLMIEYNLGVAPLHSYELKRIDSDYFEEE